jgi:hypothetical protein
LPNYPSSEPVRWLQVEILYSTPLQRCRADGSSRGRATTNTECTGHVEQEPLPLPTSCIFALLRTFGPPAPHSARHLVLRGGRAARRQGCGVAGLRSSTCCGANVLRGGQAAGRTGYGAEELQGGRVQGGRAAGRNSCGAEKLRGRGDMGRKCCGANVLRGRRTVGWKSCGAGVLGDGRATVRKGCGAEVLRGRNDMGR